MGRRIGICREESIKTRFTVEVTLPGDCNKEIMKSYIKDAVQGWKDGLDPDDPVYDLDPKTVRVIYA